VAVFAFGIGLIALVVGAEALVRGASRIALRFGVPPIVIGLTVVAIGTSAPELAVSVAAAISGEGGIAAGNVVGSNTFNVLVVLGLSAVVVPLAVLRRVVRVEVPIMLALSGAVWVLGRDGVFGRGDGAILTAALVAYIVMTVALALRERSRHDAERRATATGWRAWALPMVAVAGGLALLVVGSEWLVAGAVGIAQVFGVSDLVIGLTIVAAGTSMPELVTSIVAALRGERDIAVGNVVGSNVFNIMGVLGFASLAAPTGVVASPGLMALDVPVMVAAAALCLPFVLTRGRLDRWEGALFLGLYAGYLAYRVSSFVPPGS
jgi:cation:H+ antiporter